MNTASFNIKFSTPFCVVSGSGFKVQQANTLKEAQEIVKQTISAQDTTCAIYGEGNQNRIEIHTYIMN